MPGNATVNVINRAHSITAEVDIPEGLVEGALLSYGGGEGGFSFYMQDGRLHYAQNVVSAALLHVESTEAVPVGVTACALSSNRPANPTSKPARVFRGAASFTSMAGLVGQAEFAATVPITYGLGGGIVCGADAGSPVTPAYRPPFHFTGKLYEVTIDVSGELIRDDEAEMRLVLARQ